MIKINIDKAKDIAHTVRREVRNEEFKPFDEIISKQIPGNSFTEAENARIMIRQKYDAIQTQIDNSQTVDEIKSVLDSIK